MAQKRALALFIPSLRGPESLQLLPDSPSSSSCSSRRVRQLSLSALVYSFLPGPTGPADSSKPGRPTSRRSGFSKRRSPLGEEGITLQIEQKCQRKPEFQRRSVFNTWLDPLPRDAGNFLPIIPALAAMYLSHAAAKPPFCLFNTSLVESTFTATSTFDGDRSVTC